MRDSNCIKDQTDSPRLLTRSCCVRRTLRWYFIAMPVWFMFKSLQRTTLYLTAHVPKCIWLSHRPQKDWKTGIQKYEHTTVEFSAIFSGGFHLPPQLTHVKEKQACKKPSEFHTEDKNPSPKSPLWESKQTRQRWSISKNIRAAGENSGESRRRSCYLIH